MASPALSPSFGVDRDAVASSRTASRTAGRLVRAARACLTAHAALSIFSAVAFATFLTGTPPAWLQRPENQAALRVGWAYGPATTVVLGALAGLLHAAGRLGRRSALLVFVLGFGISLTSELSGTHTGYPFGPYSYSGLLGYKILGLVPFNIPTSWFFMLYCSLAICGRLLRAADPSLRSGQAARAAESRDKWKWAVVAACVLTAWDVSMDPAMVRTSHWLWHLAPGNEQDWLHRVFVSDAFYGMPISNWLGWLLTGTIVARVMLAIVPPTAWRARVAPTRFPLVLYAVNGVLPVTICARFGMWTAAVLGALAMLVPLVLALRAGPPVPNDETLDGTGAAFGRLTPAPAAG